ncbi:MAG TPA: hypothetical protein VIK59_02050 [Verrucomicrobiae bacterium]
MAKKTIPNVTMRVRLGDNEVEITGPSDFVEEKISEFLKKPPTQTRHETGSASVAQPPSQQASAKPKSPAQFFKSISPRTDNDRVLVATFFLEKFRNAQSATSLEIKDLIKDAKIPPPNNTSEAINQNIRKGFLMTGGDREGKTAFVLTTEGETEVEEMLKKPSA